MRNKDDKKQMKWSDRPFRCFDLPVERWWSSPAAAGDDNSEMLLLLLLLPGATDSFIVALPRQPAAAVSAVSIYSIYPVSQSISWSITYLQYTATITIIIKL